MLKIILGILIVILALGFIIAIIKAVGRFVLGFIGLAIICGLGYAAIVYFPTEIILHYGRNLIPILSVLLEFLGVFIGTLILGLIINASLKRFKLRPLYIVVNLCLIIYAVILRNGEIKNGLYYVVLLGYLIGNVYCYRKINKSKKIFGNLAQWKDDLEFNWISSIAAGFL